MTSTIKDIGRRHCIPIIYTRGTHYEVGFDVGRTMAAIIQSFLRISKSLNEDYIPAYETAVGKKNYDDTLATVTKQFPHYIAEIQGTADGAQVPFYKLFLLHMDDIVLSGVDLKNQTKQAPVGCSSIICNRGASEVIGHTEDALKEVLNHFYFVSAHIIPEKPQGRWNTKEERFTSLCYAGHLPGYTMSYNHHGVVFTINTLSALNLRPGKTPRHILTRALLGAENFEQCQSILKDTGVGAGDGCSVNIGFIKEGQQTVFYNIEMSPTDEKGNESRLNVLPVKKGEHSFHCNQYLRSDTKEANETMIISSATRLTTMKTYKEPCCGMDVKNILGDASHKEWNLFQTRPDCFVTTIALGLFDCVGKTWTLYSDNPTKNEPEVVLPLVLK